MPVEPEYGIFEMDHDFDTVGPQVKTGVAYVKLKDGSEFDMYTTNTELKITCRNDDRTLAVVPFEGDTIAVVTRKLEGF